MQSEIYTIAELQCKYHLLHNQPEGAIITVANQLFGRNEFGPWQVYSWELESNNNILPPMSNTRRPEPYMEVMALCQVVNDIMAAHDTRVVYSNDGSLQSGVGNDVVQALTIDGMPRNLPNFGIFSETRESLSELVKCTLDILCASSGYKYQPCKIVQKLNFVMTSHNLSF